MRRLAMGIAVAVLLGACGEGADGGDDGHPDRVPEDYVDPAVLAEAQTDGQRLCLTYTMTAVKRSNECDAAILPDGDEERLGNECLEAGEDELVVLKDSAACVPFWATAPCDEMRDVEPGPENDDDPCTILLDPDG